MALELSSRSRQRKIKEEEKSTLHYLTYLRCLFEEMKLNPKVFTDRKELLFPSQKALYKDLSGGLITEEEFRDSLGASFGSFCYTDARETMVCPEPLSFLHEFKDIADQGQGRSWFRGKLEAFQKEAQSKGREERGSRSRSKAGQFQAVGTDSAFLDGGNEELTGLLNGKLWFGSTLNQVNLRPGFLNDEEAKPFAVQLGDDAVHGVVVGRTGSGKSVFLNNLIFNMLTEYAPWELDLYLADFKKVEFSRYMTGKAKTPHVCACAATSEIRYVVSLISHLERCMQARQKLFTVLGETKLSDFREKYDLVLPRVVLVVDEFQQLFLEATSREAALIQDLIMSMTKLGRAVGFHLLFASQEMSGALSGKALANFKIRFALPCEAEVSSAILNNNAAVELKRGEVIVNTDSGDISKNRKFKVPFISTDDKFTPEGERLDSQFYVYLTELARYAEASGYIKIGKYYNEDNAPDLSFMEDQILGLERFRRDRYKISSGELYFDAITLGESVVYSSKTYDYETFFIERGKNKNILAASPSSKDLAYLTRLLAVNFKSSLDEALSNPKNHSFTALNAVTDKLYDISAEPGFGVRKSHSADALDGFQKTIQLRMLTKTALDTSNSPEKYLNTFYTAYSKAFEPKMNVEQTVEAALAFVREKESEGEDLLEACQELLAGKADLMTRTFAFALPPYCMRQDGLSGGKEFNPKILWISGLESIDKIPLWFNTALKNAMDVNILFILLTTSDESARAVLSACDYVFVSGNNPKMYERCGLNYTNKAQDAIAVDFKIRSLNTERAFKKCKVVMTDYEAPSIDFDEYF